MLKHKFSRGHPVYKIFSLKKVKDLDVWKKEIGLVILVLRTHVFNKNDIWGGNIFSQRKLTLSGTQSVHPLPSI